MNNKLKFDLHIEDGAIWLSKEEISLLFDIKINVVSRYLSNILKNNELYGIDDYSIKEENNQKKYNLDIIMIIAYKTKTQKAKEFIRLINNLLKDYLIKDSQSKDFINIESKQTDEQRKLTSVVREYTKALDLLDQYDHQSLIKPKGNKMIHMLTYADCKKLIDSMKYKNDSDVFGIEKEEGKLNGILAAVYQHVFGKELYPSLEEKAAHLLYFLVKDHPFVDGCKRIAATIFLEFLNKNQALIKNGQLTIANETLVSITVLTAESKPEEKDTIVNLIMNLLNH